MFTPKTILITGGAGFIGCNFIRLLLDEHPVINIINLDKLTYAGSLDNLKNLPNPERYQFIKGDICDRTLVQNLFEKYNIDTVVHFAAESHVDRSISGPMEFVQTNVVGTANLLEIARQYWLEKNQWDSRQCRFHHISTDEVFGSLKDSDPPFTEESRYQPNSPYSASKAASDHFVRAYFHTYHLPITMSNCSNNYGPFQHREKLIPTVIYACLEHKAIPIYGTGENIRDWIYVEDHCRAVWDVITKGTLGESYNIGANNEWTNIDVVRLICKIMDELKPSSEPYENLITFVSDRKGHDWRYAVGTLHSGFFAHANDDPRSVFIHKMREYIKTALT